MKLNYEPPISGPLLLNRVKVGTDTLANRSCFAQSRNSTVIYTLPNPQEIPYVMLTGSASPHITCDHCAPLCRIQVGVRRVDCIKLGEIGIEGDAHFFMVEKNNLEIADVVRGWIEQQDESAR